MRRLLAISLSVAALLAPSAALAANPASTAATPPGARDREFVIQGLVLGQQKIEASGKLAILAGSLVASVGCNSIGGKVSLDGDTVTIDTPLVMTEMACPGLDGDTEATLIKILSLGRFTITDGGWFADGGAILAEELPTAQPGPDQTPPDYPGGVEPSGVPVPLESCPPNQATGSGSGSVSGSGSGSGGGSVSSGGTVTDGGPATGGGAGGSDGSAGSGGEPGSEPGSGPDASPVDVPPATPIVEPVPVESGATVPEPPVEISPLPVDPGIVPIVPGIAPVPVPLPEMSAEPGDCYAVPADALNGIAAPGEAQTGSGTAADLATRAAAVDTATWPLLAVLFVAGMAIVGMAGRWMLGARRTGTATAAGAAATGDVTRP